MQTTTLMPLKEVLQLGSSELLVHIEQISRQRGIWFNPKILENKFLFCQFIADYTIWEYSASKKNECKSG